MKKLILVGLILSILILNGCAQQSYQQSAPTAVCGDGKCEYGESCGNCWRDCCLEEHREKYPDFDECREGCPGGRICRGHWCERVVNPK